MNQNGNLSNLNLKKNLIVYPARSSHSVKHNTRETSPQARSFRDIAEGESFKSIKAKPCTL